MGLEPAWKNLYYWMEGKDGDYQYLVVGRNENE